MDTFVLPLSLAELADTSYEFLVSMLRNLDQADVEALVEADPAFFNLIQNLPNKDFPRIQLLHFFQSSQNPICVRKLYENVRVDVNLLSSHPVAQAILRNSEYLRNLTIGCIDVDAVSGTLVNDLLGKNIQLNSFTIETLSYNPFQLLNRPMRLFPSNSVSVQDFRILSISRRVQYRHYFAHCWAIASLLNSFQRIGVCEIPNHLLSLSTPLQLLLNDTGNVDQFSLQNSAMDENDLREVVLHAEVTGRRLIHVPFRVSNVLSVGELSRLFGSTIQTTIGMNCVVGERLDIKQRTILGQARQLHLNIENELFILDASTAQSNQRSVILTSADNAFPADGLRRLTALHSTLRWIFQEFGRFDTLDIRNCRPNEGAEAVQMLYSTWIGRIVS